MATKTGVGGSGPKKRNQSLDTGQQRTAAAGVIGAKRAVNPLGGNPNQSKFSVAPLILEGVKLNKLQLNDLVKQQRSDIKILDIQLSRSGVFTLFAADVKSFNKLLNDFAAVLSANGQAGAKIYVPRSIQRIKDTENVAFVKRVDIEIPTDRITEALKNLGLDVINVTRLTSKDGKTPIRTIKETFSDAANRNTFVHTGLQVDSMHFPAEAATQNTKPVQCYICLKYNHIAKYCKTNKQVCARCGENHRLDQCNADKDVANCCNCKGNHLANSSDCSYYKEQEKKMRSMVYQFSSTNKPSTPIPALHDPNEFPSLPNSFKRQQDDSQNDFFERIITILSSKMEKIIEETTSRLFEKLHQKIKKVEESLGMQDNNQDDALTISDSESSEEESRVVQHIKE